MGLRYRLWLVLSAVVLVPLVVAGVVIVRTVSAERDARVAATGDVTARAVGSSLQLECQRLGALSAQLAAEAQLRPAGRGVDAAVARARTGEVSYAAVVTAAGEVHDGGVRRPADPRTVRSCEVHLDAPLLVGVTPVDEVGRAVVVASVDGAWLQQALRDVDSTATVTVLADGRPVASSLGAGAPRRVDGEVVTSRAVEPGSRLVVAVAQPAPGERGLVLATLLALLVAGALVAALVRLAITLLVKPLLDLTEASERVVAGDLDATLPTASDDEVGRLGRSLSLMTAEMRQYLGQLQRSRDELRDNLERLGDALGSTHDLDGLVQVVLESAVAAVEAKAGVAYVAESAGALTLVAAQGIEDLDAPVARRLLPGHGVLGRVASGGAPVRGRLGTSPGEITPGPDDPAGCEVLAVPLRGGGRVTGVLVLLDHLDGSGFGPAEEEEIRGLASQAGIAVDNVLLHRETERLAITDPLTGLWNFRYLSMSLAREIERATRFDRSLAVLMLDIDRFKAINDTHGHATGDAVLREFAARVGEKTRDVDVLARYGGEEFVLVLPETLLDGAVQLGERVREAIRELPFPGPEGGPGIPVTVSIGIAAFPEHGGSPATLLRSADAALYAAKRAGRDRVVVGAGSVAGWDPS
ncbi:diguanylate cyclase (GGDEF)-like protein [Motilibacter peucedani]|uniref:Diguanylate cyclase (GGDEF)-like protein n=1 Tax=Motilibacter peucedani TaxID=598650 RepID=A0A420XKM8_9ACTN|nr:diguanylate cyclase [Motilibacter peucedani]RKS68583.1 diguanylate cyclase (GGDEF)-like protein [Motilibacter peucedani]